MSPGGLGIVVEGEVVVVAVVELDSDGPDSVGANASAAAPAMIKPDEQIAAMIFQVIDELRPGSEPLADPAPYAHDRSRPEVQPPSSITWPIPLEAAGTSCDPAIPRRRRGFPSPHRRDRPADEARLSVTEMRPDDHERPGAQIANSLRK